MAVTKLFRNTTSPIIASFNYTDIAEGTGVVVFLGGTTVGDLFLRNSAWYSNDIMIGTTGTNSATYVTIQDVDFDVTFNSSKTLNGTVIVSVTHGWHKVGVGTAFSKVEAKLIHYDGSTETLLGTDNSDEYSSALVGQANSETAAMEFAISNVRFKAGETLRLSIKQEGKVSNNTANFGIGCDPKDRNDQTVLQVIEDDTTTLLELHVPFKIPGF